MGWLQLDMYANAILTILKDNNPKSKSSIDGVPLIQDMEEGPKSHARSNASSKVQAMAQSLEKSQTDATRLNSQKIPSFFHLIS